MATGKKAPGFKTLKATAKSEPYNSEKSRTYDPRPVISISETDLPSILKWTMDGKYKIKLEVEMVGITEEDWEPNKGKKVARLRITKIGLDESETK